MPISGIERLLRVEVDLGTEQRTLVAGMARRYTPEQLVGSQVIVAANVEPATIRGVTVRLGCMPTPCGGLSVLEELTDHFATALGL